MEHVYVVRQLDSLDVILGAPYEFMKQSEAANNILLGLLSTERNKPKTFDKLWFYAVYRDSQPVLCAMQTEKRSIRYPLLVSALANKAELPAVKCLRQFLAQRNAQIAELAGFTDVVASFTDLSGWKLIGQQNLYVLQQVTGLPTPSVRGMRVATEADLTVAQDWYLAFMSDVRQPAANPQQAANYKDVIKGMIASRQLFMWEDTEGHCVSMAGIIRETETVCVLGPVYSPQESRGKGFASHLVVALCALILDRKKTPCLFADTWNPTSNRMYSRIGFAIVGSWERWHQEQYSS